MFFRRLLRQNPGEVIRASTINRTIDIAEWATQLRVAPPLELSNTPAGPLIRIGALLGGRVFWCRGTFSAATGTWPTITPQHQSLDVYQNVKGSLSKAATSAKVYWWFPDASGSNKLIAVISNGDGTYNAINASCSGI